MSGGILKCFKPLKDGELTPKARKMALNEVDKCEWAVPIGWKRGHYDFVSGDDKLKVAKYASDKGVTESLRYFESTVR